MNRFSPHIRGILFAVAGYTFWVLNDTCIKLSADAAIPLAEVAAIVSFSGLAALLIKTVLRGETRRLRPRSARNQIASAVLAVAALSTCVTGLKHLPFIVFYVTVFTTPMVVVLFAAAILKEHLTFGKIAAVIAGFAGVVVATNPFGGAVADNMHGDWIGYAAVAGNVLSFALLMILQRHIMKTETEESVAFIQIFVQTLACGFVTIFIHVPVGPQALFILCAGGVIGILGNLCNIVAAKHTTASTVAQFHYTQIIGGGIIGFFVWREVPTAHLLAGSAIIIASGLYIAHHMRKADIEPIVKSL